MSSYQKNVLRSIKNSFARFIAIFAIIALGVGFFAGLRATKPSFYETCDQYLRDTKFFDFQLLSTIGITDEDIDAIRQIEGVQAVEGEYYKDSVCYFGEKDDSYVAYVVRFHSLTQGVNEPTLIHGRMPEAPNEIVVDDYNWSEDVIGDVIHVDPNDDDNSSEELAYTDFTIVGTVRSPEYMNFQRGSTSVGSGTISFYAYTTREAFDMEYYTEAYVYYGTDDYAFSDEYEEFAQDAQSELEQALEVAIGDRFDSYMLEAREELDDGWNEYYSEMEDAQADLDSAEAELNDAYLELQDADTQIQDGREALSQARDEIADNQLLIDENMADLEEAEAQLAQANEAITAGYAEIEAQRATANATLAELNSNAVTVQAQIDYLNALAAGGADVTAELSQAQAIMDQINAGILQAQAGLSQIDSAQAELDANNAQYQTQLAEATEARSTLEQSQIALDEARAECDRQEAELEMAVEEYEDGYEQYLEGQAEYNDGLAEFNDSFAEAQQDLLEGEEELADVDTPESYVLGRDTNVGYVSFDTDAQIVDGVSTVFPIFFFLIAALVCSTTMQRMVSDERNQIGIMRALGYSEMAVMMKYVTYSGLAAVLGCALGYQGGIKLFPWVIWEVYDMMYGFSDIIFKQDTFVFVISLFVSLLCSVCVTIFTAKAEMNCAPAELIRPKAPLAGKRILLERISPIWKRMKFNQKVSARNIFRFKKRMWMMIVGIAGCTSLVITGFGLSDSISGIVGYQYDEILKYDLDITYSDDTSMDYINEQISLCDEEHGVTEQHISCRFVNMTHNGEDFIRDVYVIASDDPNVLDIIGITRDGVSQQWPETGTIAISNKLADENNLEAGDIITLGYGDEGRTVDVEIAYVFDNYIYHYAFINAETYSMIFDEEYSANRVLMSIDECPYSDSEYANILTEYAESERWTSIDDYRESFQETINQLNSVVILIIGCAAALAFIVLFNLNNINITERIRELATLKVLGLSRKETYQYIFRENSVLVFFGILVGIPFGKALHMFVLSQIKMDTVTFANRITLLSYVVSFFIVFLFAFAVEFIMQRKIDKIHMAESLKSIE